MLTRFIALLLLGLASVLGAPCARAQRPAPDAQARFAVDVPPEKLGAARERWNKLTPQERAALLERYRSFREFDPAMQRELVDRARRVRESEQRITETLGPDMREKMRELDPARRREFVRELVTGEARGKGLELRSLMPDEWAQKLENASPSERPKVLDTFRRQHLNRLANMAIDRLGKRLNLSPEEIDARKSRNLSFEQRAANVLEMRKAVQALDANENGLLPGMSADDWQELQALPPEQFYQRIQAYRAQRIAEQAAREARGEPKDPELAGEPPPGPRGASGPPGSDGARRPPPGRPLIALEGLRQLREVIRPDPRDLVKFIDLEPEDRARRSFELRRDRCLDVLRTFDLAPPQRIDELRDMPEPAFHANMRRMLAPLHAAEHGLLPPDGGPDRRPPPRFGPAFDRGLERGFEPGGEPPHPPPPGGVHPNGPRREGPPPDDPPPRERKPGEDRPVFRSVPGRHDGGLA